MTRPDITIRGAGIFGLSCAYEMARRGAKVTVVDPNGIGAGASGGLVGALAPHAPEGWTPIKAFQLESLLASPGFWGEVQARSGRDPGYGQLGRVQPIADAAALARAYERQQGAQELWQGAALWEVLPATGASWEPPSPSGYLIRDSLSARIHPRLALAALAEALRSLGGMITPEAEDQGLVLDASGAAGLEALSRDFGKMLGRGQKGQAALLAYDAGAAPQLYVDSLHIVPHIDGTVAVGSVDDREAQDLSTDARLEALIAEVRRVIPALAEAPVLERWAGYRPRARSRRAVLGAHPLKPGRFVANGGFKIGFGIAPGVARVMADLMLDGIDQVPDGCRVEDLLAAN